MMKRIKVIVACLVLLGAGVALGAGGMFTVLYKRTGHQMVMKLDRMANKARGVTPSSEGTWIGRSKVPVNVEAHSRGWDAPVRLVFPPEEPLSNDDPVYYVAEMGGAIRILTLGGDVLTFADDLLNFDRRPMDELGLLGMALDPDDRSLFVTMTYWDEGAGVYRNKVERLGMSEDGKTMTDRTVLLDMADEATVPSYQIQFASIGPDDLLYVGVGSGADKIDAQDLDKFAGKVIRMDKDGRADPSNPFYDPARPDSACSYIYAYGLRNPFDLAWDPYTGEAVVSDVGPGIDRIVRLEEGLNYCFGDADDQMRTNALYTWGPNVSGGYAPVGLTITPGDALTDRPSLYVGLFGSVHRPGPNEGKRVLRFDFNPRGYLFGAATDLAVYGGSMFSSVVDVEAGPDGSIYFTDLWGESHEPHEKAGVVYRIVPGDPDSVVEDAGEGLTGDERFAWLMERHTCYGCHVLDGRGHVVGPSLTDLGPRLRGRLNSPEYAVLLDDLMARPGTFFQDHRPVYEQLKQLNGDQRVRYWTEQFLKNPRFDDPRAKMPSYAHLPEEDIKLLVDRLVN